jgi:putative DNA primase/helicase
MQLLGTYAVTLQPDFLLVSAKNNELETLELRGARLAVSNELPESGKLAEGRLKSLTGGDMQKGRGLYQNHQTFRPTAKFINLANHRPYVTSGGDAIWSRIRLVPCNHIATPETMDLELGAKLEKELSGILNWALQGLDLFKKHDNKEVIPKQMREDLAEYRENEDSLGSFIAEYCTVRKDLQCDKSDLYRLYKIWAIEEGEFVTSQKCLNKKLSERGIKSYRSSSARKYLGIGIN